MNIYLYFCVIILIKCFRIIITELEYVQYSMFLKFLSNYKAENISQLKHFKSIDVRTNFLALFPFKILRFLFKFLLTSLTLL
jgi:hypothetical protein